MLRKEENSEEFPLSLLSISITAGACPASSVSLQIEEFKSKISQYLHMDNKTCPPDNYSHQGPLTTSYFLKEGSHLQIFIKNFITH